MDVEGLTPQVLAALVAADVPGDLRALAARAEVVATEVEILAVVVAGTGELEWESPAAALHEEQVDARERALTGLADGCRALAGALAGLAGTVEERLELLASLLPGEG